MKSETNLKSTATISLVMFLVFFVFVTFFMYQFVSATESNQRPNEDGTIVNFTNSSIGISEQTFEGAQ